MGRKVFCDNMLVDSIKNYTIDQLRVFYNIIYLYREESIFKGQDARELYIAGDYMRYIFKKSKVSLKNEIQVIDTMPSKINFIDKDAKCTGAMSVFEIFEYDYNSEEYLIVFTEAIIPYLEAEDNYSNIDLSDLQQLRSKNSIRMYELACKFKNQHNYTMPIKTFNLYFQTAKSYKMSDIDKNILNPSILEIQAVTERTIKVEKIKKGKEVTHIKFIFG